METTSKKMWKTTKKKMEDNLKKNGRRPQKNEKMEDDLKKNRRLSFGIQPINQNKPNWL